MRVRILESKDELSPYLEKKLVKHLEILNNKWLNVETRSIVVTIITELLQRTKNCIKYHEKMKTMKEKDESLQIIPLKQLLNVATSWLNKKHKNFNKNDVFISPFFLNLLFSFVCEGVRNITFLLNEKASTGDDNIRNQCLPSAGRVLNHETNKHEQRVIRLIELQIIDTYVINSLFRLFHFNSILSDYQMIQLFRVFIRILPFLRYYKSNNANSGEIESNRLLFAPLFDVTLGASYVNSKISNKVIGRNGNKNSDEKSDNINQHIAVNVVIGDHIKQILEMTIDFMFCKFTSESEPNTPNGLSKSRHKTISQHYSLIRNQKLLENIQINLMKFLLYIGFDCLFISIQDLYVPSIIGSYNGCGYKVQQTSLKLFEKIKNSNEINFEDSIMIKKIIEMFVGSDSNVTDEKSDDFRLRMCHELYIFFLVALLFFYLFIFFSVVDV